MGGFVIENLLAATPDGTQAHYYRTGGGAEIDLLLSLPGGELWAVEIKRSTAPAPSRGFHESVADLRPRSRFVVYPGTERFPLRDAEAVPLIDLARDLVRLRERSGSAPLSSGSPGSNEPAPPR